MLTDKLCVPILKHTCVRHTLYKHEVSSASILSFTIDRIFDLESHSLSFNLVDIPLIEDVIGEINPSAPVTRVGISAAACNVKRKKLSMSDSQE